jgi:hypothetical protein
VKIGIIINNRISKFKTWFQKFFEKNQEIICFRKDVIVENISNNYYKQTLDTKEEFDDIDTRLQLTYNSNIESKGWRTPGQEKAHSWCGSWKAHGCPNAKTHQILGYGHTKYVRQYKKSCFRGSCEKCMTRWATRQALAAAERVQIYKNHKGGELKHLKISLPINYDFSDIKKTRKDIIKILKEKGAEGGSIIFCPFELDGQNNTWVEMPYFFVSYYGKVIDENFIKGWSITNKISTKSHEVIFYVVLRMSGMKKGKDSLIWFGALSYSKLKLVKPVRKPNTCPLCDAKLYPLIQLQPNFKPDSWKWGFYDSDYWKLAEPEKRYLELILTTLRIPYKMKSRILDLNSIIGYC